LGGKNDGEEEGDFARSYSPKGSLEGAEKVGQGKCKRGTAPERSRAGGASCVRGAGNWKERKGEGLRDGLDMGKTTNEETELRKREAQIASKKAGGEGEKVSVRQGGAAGRSIAGALADIGGWGGKEKTVKEKCAPIGGKSVCGRGEGSNARA